MLYVVLVLVYRRLNYVRYISVQVLSIVARPSVRWDAMDAALKSSLLELLPMVVQVVLFELVDFYLDVNLEVLIWVSYLWFLVLSTNLESQRNIDGVLPWNCKRGQFGAFMEII